MKTFGQGLVLKQTAKKQLGNWLLIDKQLGDSGNAIDQLGKPPWSSFTTDADEWMFSISETQTAYQTSGGLKLWTACSKISSQAERTGGFGLQSKVCSNNQCTEFRLVCNLTLLVFLKG